MPEPELSLMFVRPLNRLGVRYMVTGSVAAILYGEPRFTNDVDFVVFLRADDETFPSPEFYVPPEDVIATEVARESHGHFNIIHSDTGFKADFYPTGRSDLSAWAFRNIRRLEFQGEQVVVAPPESVIVSKLEFYKEGGSEKHIRDIRAMLAVSGDLIDRGALNEWIQRRRVESEWRLVNDL
jgi:hypothetical protein